MPPMDDLPPLAPEVLSRCEAVAEKMPLIHVTSGRLGRPMLWDIAGGEIPTSEVEHGYCGPTTRAVEADMNLPPSVYFYSGRAHPRYGDVALAFHPEIERKLVHSATPFDSGGVARDDDRGFRFTLPDGMTRADFARASVVGADWRGAFARWLAAYYPSGVAGYWERPPERVDPDGLYTATNEWAAWTWEVRFSRGPAVMEAVAWATTDSHLREIRNALAEQWNSPDDVDRLEKFLGRLLTQTGSYRHNEGIEQWTRAACL